MRPFSASIHLRESAVASVLRQRRKIGHALVHAPATLRALVRADEIWLVLLAGVVGALAGATVVAMSSIAQHMHRLFYALGRGEFLSSQLAVNPLRALLVPSLGGLALGLASLGAVKWISRRVVDPIEANALYGGSMSMKDSLVVVAQTIWSNGVGASVGLEAGYAQIGSALASRFGRYFRLRRSDMRLMVGCGAAGAIAAAFNAPLTGSFYAFELVMGTYSLATLAPVVMAAISAVTVMRMLLGNAVDTFDIRIPTVIEAIDYVPILALGMLCALVGIAIMRGVTIVEDLFRRSKFPLWARPAVGGLALGTLALITPAVLSSGHSAMRATLDTPYPLQHILLLMVLKAVASAVSIGSGFRGGLFFASLFLGALLGKAFAALLAMVTVVQALPAVVCALVGMSGLAVAVVGGPLTMAFLALESTGSLPMTVAVLLPQMTIKEAVGLFETAESDELAVVDSAESMRVIGTLTEQYALRRYTDELEKRRRELSGE